MKFFAILLCIAIGSVFGELQRRKFWKEKLEVTEDVNEVRSPISVDDGKSPYSSNESLRGTYAQDNSFDQIVANTKDADSAEKETPRNPSPVIETSTVKPTSSKAIKKNFEIMYIRKPERKETNLASNSRKFLRIKRMAEVEDPTNVVESYKMYKKDREKLPAQLRMKMRKTDTAEEKLLNSYATSNGDTSNLIADYNSAKSAEREQLKVDASGSGATEVIKNYKALRKGKPWNYIKLRGKLQGLFGKPSPSFTEYETLKQDEVASIDSFLGGSSNTESEMAKTVEPQEKEKPAEEKATNVQPQEKKNPTDEKDWLSTEPANTVLKETKKRAGDDNAEHDSHMFDTWIDEDLERADFNDSFGANSRLYEYLSQDIKVPMWNTDAAETDLLGYSRDAGKFRKAYLDIYYEYRRKEIEALKAHLATKSEKLRERILFFYKYIRRGVPCDKIKFLSKGFFEGSVPKPALDKYLAVKKEELYTDQYLDGSMKIGEVPKIDENAKAEAFEKASSQTKSENANRKLRAEVAQVARAEEDEKAEEMERGVRAKETETVEVEYDAYRENVENIVATSDDAKEDVEVHGSPDNVTSDDATANTGKAMTSGGVALKPCLTWVLFALLKVVGALETALPSVKEIPEAIPEPVANLYNQLLTVASFSFLFGGLSMIIVLGLYIDELGFRRPGIVGGTIASSNLAFVNNNPACLFSKLFRICQGVGGGGFSLWQVAVIMVLGGLFFASFSVSVALVALYFFQ